MDVNKIRRDFPALNDKGTVYFDSACQSLRPQVVMDAMNQYYLTFPGLQRTQHAPPGCRSNAQVDDARVSLAKFLNAAKKEEIVFTRNTTEGINLVANSLFFKPGDVLLISDKEHNSNLIPWQKLCRQRGTVLKIVPSQPDNTFDLDAYTKLLDPRVRLVSLGHTSNLDGVTIPAAEIIKLAHQNGSLVLLDAAQSAPHRQLNVEALDVDFLAFSGHKMLGPSGTGVLYGKYTLLEEMEPFMVGGDTVASSTYETC